MQRSIEIFYQPLLSLHDPLLPAWLDLYETSFPPEERVLISYILEILKSKESGREVGEELLAAVDKNNNLLGLLFTNRSFQLHAGALYYFAVSALLRSQGLGAQIYQEAIRRCQSAGCRLMVFDLEDPAYCSTPESQALAHRRIAFYVRQGAHILAGAQFTLRLYPSSPGAHLKVMVHHFEPTTPQEALLAARELLSDTITPAGVLEFI